MNRRNIIARYVSAPGAAAQSHRRRKIGRKTDRAVCRRRIDNDARRGHFRAVSNRRIAILRVHSGGVSHSAELQNLQTFLRSGFNALGDDQG